MTNRFWLTPPDLYAALNAEFNFDFDPCPCPKPDDFDSLTMPYWGDSSYINPPFRKHDGGGFGPTAWVHKAIEQHRQGRSSVLLLPTHSYVNLLLDEGAEIRPMGRIRWREVDTGEEWKAPQHCSLFILR